MTEASGRAGPEGAQRGGDPEWPLDVAGGAVGKGLKGEGLPNAD
jgi:hypothetical protein